MAATSAWSRTLSSQTWRSTFWPIRRRMERTERTVPSRFCHLPLLPITSFISATFASRNCQTSATSTSTSKCATWIPWIIHICTIISIKMAMEQRRWQLSSRKRSQLRLRRKRWMKARTTLTRRRWCPTFITTCNSTLNTTISNLRQHLPPLIIRFWQQMDTSLQTF